MYFATLALSSYLVAFGMLPQQESPSPTPQQQNQADRDGDEGQPPQQSKSQVPVSIETNVTVVGNEQAPDDANDSQAEAQRIQDFWIGLGAIVVAGFAVLFAGLAWRASNRQAVAAETLLEIKERPNVFFSKIDVIEFTEDHIWVTLFFKNDGGTQATNCYIGIEMKILGRDQVPTVKQCQAVAPMDVSTVAAGSEIPLPWSLQMTGAEFSDIKHSRRWLWAYGIITFQSDIPPRPQPFWRRTQAPRKPLNIERFDRDYAARYIGWKEPPRPRLASDFWIYNGSGGKNRANIQDEGNT